MSPPPKRKRASGNTSQANCSQIDATQRSQHNEEMHNLSLEELTKKCVRFLLTKMSSNLAIKRQDIVQNVFHEKPGKHFETVLNNARKTLKQVYGLDVEVIDSDSNVKKYFVTNCLPYAHLIARTNESDVKTTLTFLILTHIFMCLNKSTETEMWNFLKEFNLLPDTHIEDIGTVKHFVTQTLVRQNFICIEDTNDSETEQKKSYFKWGSRAEESVSKMSVLKFICEVYDSPNVKFWNEQYKLASQQFAQQDRPQE